MCLFSKANKTWVDELDIMRGIEFYTGYKHPDMDLLERKERLLFAIKKSRRKEVL